MLYRRPRAGLARGPATPTLQLEGTTTTLDGTVLDYLTVPSAAAEVIAGTEGWTDLTTTIGRPLSDFIK